MAQSALTVTPPNPTPPTNFSCTGATPPNPPNYTKNTYEDYRPDMDFDTYPPPYFDDGTAGALNAYAAATSALASGSGDTAGGTGNPVGSTAGTAGTYPGAANGTVPASTSSAHEEVGNVTTVTATGNIAYSYPGPVVFNTTQAVSDGPALTAGTLTSPNQLHASTMTPATNPALSSITPTTAVKAASGTQLITCTGTNFTRQCVIWVNNMARDTTFTSATSIACTVNKSATATIWNVDVKLGGVAVPSTRQFTWT